MRATSDFPYTLLHFPDTACESFSAILTYYFSDIAVWRGAK